MAMAALRRADGNLLMSKIVMLIETYISRLNINKNMSAQQIAWCAQDICNSDNVEVYALSLDDIQLCLNRGISGEYGEIYDRIDQTVIFGWLKKYWAQRSDAVAKQRHIEQGAERQNIHEVFQNDTMAEILHDVVNKLRVPDKTKPDVRATVLSEAEKQILKEWDDLPYYEETNLKEYNGVVCDFTEYANARLK